MLLCYCINYLNSVSQAAYLLELSTAIYLHFLQNRAFYPDFY